MKAHSDLAATKTMLTDEPMLLNATWDWGGGDFETGIGGAGHMGNREIAEFLIGKGARLDVFVAAMLNRVPHHLPEALWRQRQPLPAAQPRRGRMRDDFLLRVPSGR